MARRRSFVLSLDEGTTGTTAMVFDDAGRPLATGYHEITQHFPRPGWVEHDAEEIFSRTLRSARVALRRAGVAAGEVAAVGITNQRETLVAWDARTGHALRPAIVWQDRRTSDECSRLKRDGEEPWVSRKTGLRLDPYFSGSKLHWLVQHDVKVQRARKQGRLRWGTIDSWLAWKLSGGAAHVTDASNASRTLLMDLRRVAWDDELLALFGARREELPDIVDSSGEAATVEKRFLGAEVPIAGIAGDQQSALFGQACFRPGLAKNTYGTGCFALVNAGSRPAPARGGLLSTLAWRIQGRSTYALEGAVFVAGAVVQWLRDGLGVIRRAAETEPLAQGVADSGGVVFVPAFTGLGAPYWDPYARGTIVGLTRGSTRAHLARAALESISFQSAQVVDLLRRHSGQAIPRLRVDGGATANGFLMQHQADVLGIPVERSSIQETTALGAAYLAGLGAGVWPSLGDVERRWRLGKRFSPRSTPKWRRGELARWRKAVERSRDWARDPS